MVVKTLLYFTRKCGCEGGVVSASCRLQPDRHGSTGQVPLLEKETFSWFVVTPVAGSIFPSKIERSFRRAFFREKFLG